MKKYKQISAYLHGLNVKASPDPLPRKILLTALIALSVILMTASVWYYLNHGEHNHGILHYTCPMHPQIKEKKPGKCPVCHMDLVPVYKQSGVHNDNKSKKEETFHLHIVTSRIQLLGVKKYSVYKGTLKKEIRSPGRAALDPDLAVAVREYIHAAGDPSLRQAAQSRLRLLGMGEEEISNLLRSPGAYDSLSLSGKNAQRVWIYAAVYEPDSAFIRPGMKADILYAALPGQRISGTVKSLSPSADPVTRSVTARILTDTTVKALRPGSFTEVIFRFSAGEGLIIPRSALVITGQSDYVFRMDPDGVFTPLEVSILAETSSEALVSAPDNTSENLRLKEGDIIAATGAFLLDSESRLQNLRTGEGHLLSSEGGSHDTVSH